MKATSKLHICISHCSKDCLGQWYEQSVEDEPIYDYCKNCYSQMCIDERELMKGVGE